MRIHFENEDYDLRQFTALCHEKINLKEKDDWRQPVFQFFLEWHNAKQTIAVKTSGSTGEAKSITIEKKHITASALATLNYLGIRPGGTAWLCLPAQHIAGKMMIVRALVGGLDLWISKPESQPTLPPEIKITLAAMVPLQLQNLSTSRQLLNQLDSNINQLLIGGTSLTSALDEFILQFSNATLWHTYGMTETISHIALRKLNGSSAAKTFEPFPGVHLSLNNKGCLVIDYPAIGINKLHTNDLATILEDNSFTIDGRADFIINSGGIKLNPEVIERKLDGKMPCPVFITSLPDQLLGEKAILIMEGSRELMTEICDFWKIIESHLHKTEIPREIHFITHFIRTENGKLRRNSTRDLILNNCLSVD